MMRACAFDLSQTLITAFGAMMAGDIASCRRPESPCNHQLAGFGARGAEAHAVDDVVKTRFEQLEQVFTRRTLCDVLRFGNVRTEPGRSRMPWIRRSFCFSRSCRP